MYAALSRTPFTSYLMLLFENGVCVQNLSQKNVFYSHEDEPVAGTHFHMNGFSLSRLVLIQRQLGNGLLNIPAHLNPAISYIWPEAQTLHAVRKGITFHPLMRLSSSLSSDSFDHTQLPQVNLQILVCVSMSCYPGPSSSMTSPDVKTCSVRSVLMVV